MSALERWVLREVRASWCRTREPVRTVVLADRVGKHDRTVRAVLVRLEQREMVRRRGMRGGWLPGPRCYRALSV